MLVITRGRIEHLWGDARHDGGRCITDHLMDAAGRIGLRRVTLMQASRQVNLRRIDVRHGQALHRPVLVEDIDRAQSAIRGTANSATALSVAS